MDFYIASRVGEVYGKGSTDTIAIVSRDKGFAAVREYWGKEETRRKIILKPDIEQCILSANEPSARRKLIQNQRQILCLEREYQKYLVRKKLFQRVQVVLGDKLQIEETEDLVTLLQEEKRKKQAYLSVLKRFGREKGLFVYRELREIVEGKSEAALKNTSRMV